MGAIERRLQVVRSDWGDGGWSLHPAEATDEAIAEGAAPTLLTGDAVWIGDDWSRPNTADYVRALQRLQQLEQYGTWRRD